MTVLVDTSVWAEYFRSRPGLSRATLDSLAVLIESGEVATLRPIQAEVLSGYVARAHAADIEQAFEAMPHLDLDWNAPATWQELVDLASFARSARLGVPGLVDRMVLRSAERAGAALWTLDRPLRALARRRGVALVE